MKKITLIVSAGIFLFTAVVSAQQNTDSLALVVKIGEYQLKLAKLQNTVDDAKKNKEVAADKAQASADENITAATNLSSHPEDKTLAKDASNQASDAKSDAKKGRKEADKLDKLRKDIREMKGKIADEQAKLNRFTVNSTTSSGISPLPVQPDTSRHN